MGFAVPPRPSYHMGSNLEYYTSTEPALWSTQATLPVGEKKSTQQNRRGVILQFCGKIQIYKVILSQKSPPHSSLQRIENKVFTHLPIHSPPPLEYITGMSCPWLWLSPALCSVQWLVHVVLFTHSPKAVSESVSISSQMCNDTMMDAVQLRWIWLRSLSENRKQYERPESSCSFLPGSKDSYAQRWKPFSGSPS